MLDWRATAALMRNVTPARESLDHAAKTEAIGPLGWLPFRPSGSFDSWGWVAYRRLMEITWDSRGSFHGRPVVEARGGRDYFYRPDPADPFYFIRGNGSVVTPAAMRTDGGSVPRFAWLIPGIDPWYYMPAYLLHDWLFMTHHCRPDQGTDFATANAILAEGIFTLMQDGTVPADWRTVEMIYRACSSYVGRKVWNTSWTDGECAAALP